MILADNALFLKKKFPMVWSQLQKNQENDQDYKLSTYPSKSGVSTLAVEAQGTSLMIHSKYSPIEEAEQFIEQFQDVEKYQQVFFFGVGLGYHIEVFANRYPGIPMILYEPSAAVLEAFLSRISLAKLRMPCKSIYLETNETEPRDYIREFVEGLNEEVMLVYLPSYERVFTESYLRFTETFKESLKRKATSLQVNNYFEKRWVFNSLVNMKETISTPNILLVKTNVFRDKPAIVVAAGPSLQDEVVNLKYIKEQGLAYILSVGTSINALLDHGILPDAACTYDPTQLNQKVFEKMSELNVIDIPLIYGSSVGFEVLENYKGPKLHVLTSQDSIAPYYLRSIEGQPLDGVHDASTISVIVIQMLQKLKCRSIVLVGQNLAFRDRMLYSEGAFVLGPEMEELPSGKDLSLYVESVDGVMIESTKDFIAMKTQIEAILARDTGMEVINTTRGGAKIAHTTFVPLEDIIRTRLKERVVDPHWYHHEGYSYDLEYAKDQALKMKEDYEQLRKSFNQITSIFNDIHRCKEHKDRHRLGKLFPKFDKTASKIFDNRFFKIFLKPMNRVQEELLLKKIGKIKFEKDPLVKAEMVIEDVGKFMYVCQQDMANIKPIFDAIQKYIIELSQRSEEDVQ